MLFRALCPSVSIITDNTINMHPITIVKDTFSLRIITPSMILTIGSKVLNIAALEGPIIFMPFKNIVRAKTVDTSAMLPEAKKLYGFILKSNCPLIMPIIKMEDRKSVV